ncbi:MAG TPA: F0F1 ATP synthase subunit A [Patescibacteria group bacterium]|nr:F0F1 ATP synthase subunit A [Patescibacteria group bacterium]
MTQAEVNLDYEVNNLESQLSATQEIKQETTLFAEPVFNLKNFTVTNSLLTSWLAVLIIIVLAVVVRLKIKRLPRGLQNYLEVILEGALNLADSVTTDRKKTLKFFPLVFSLFLFIILNNWLGLLPGVGSIGYVIKEHNEFLFIPYLRGATADLNTTLALAILAVIATHWFGIMAVNFWNHFNRFFGVKYFFELPKKIFVEREYTAVLVNPIKFFVGIIEFISELAKVASLSFRLFGNIFAGEVLLAAMALIFAYLLPIPFIFLEILIGLIQALIFAMLTLVFLTVATTDHEAH